jgi:hypothetical protein
VLEVHHLSPKLILDKVSNLVTPKLILLLRLCRHYESHTISIVAARWQFRRCVEGTRKPSRPSINNLKTICQDPDGSDEMRIINNKDLRGIGR